MSADQIDIEGVSASIIGEQLNASFLDCAVCANQFSVDGERVPAQLCAAAGESCEHSVCAACAEQLLAREPRLCPLCRLPLVGFARNRLAIQLLLAAKVLQRRTSSSSGGEDEAARLRARIADTEQLLQQHSTQNESAQAELRRLQRQREEALRALEYYQGEEARAAQQLAEQAHQYGLTLQDLHDARQQLDYYRRDRRQVEENRRLAVLLNDEVQRLQDSLASMYEQLGTRDSDAHRWQRLYASALDDLHDKEAEVEALKRTVQQHHHHHQQQPHPTTATADPSSWLSRAASWIRGTTLTPVPGVLVQQLDQYTLHERLGAALNSSVFLAEEKDSKRRVAVKRINYTLDDRPSTSPSSSSSSSSSASASSSSLSIASPTAMSSSPPSAAAPLPGSLSASSVAPRLRKIVDVCREAMLLRVLQHDNIVSLVGFVHLPDTAEALLVMDYMPFDLQFQLANRHIGSEAQLRAVVQQLLCAVLYMHTSQAVHRAIGTTTVLLDASGRVRLAGMRDARSLHSSPLDAVHVPADVKYAYWAPELADFAADPARHRLTSAAWKAVDMWAVGVVFAEMILGEALFAAASPQALFESLASCKELRPAISLGLADASPLLHQQLVRVHAATVSLLDRIRSSYFLTRPGSRGLSKDCLQLLFALLKFDATQRLTAAEALASPFFARADLPHYKSVANQITDAEIADFARVNLGLRFF